MKKTIVFLAGFLACVVTLPAIEIEVAINGSDTNPGTKQSPFRTVQHAADVAQPGDVITVHQGVYRERVNPPRGGTSDLRRITYQAAPGERVTITGSEPMKGWDKISGDTWKVTIPNSFFGKFNPYADRIHGDWCSNPRGYHTGAVYLNGDWLTEAAHLNDVLKPAGRTPLWFATVDGVADGGPEYLMNIAFFQAGMTKIPAEAMAAKDGTQLAACSEGGRCVGFIRQNNWLRYDAVDFGSGTERVEFRAAAATGAGGEMELHLDNADGELLGVCNVPSTGDWQKWQTFTTKIKPVSGVKNLCLVFKPIPTPAKPGADNTVIYAQFPGVNPNAANVEINVRETVFTPSKTGINYLTVRGFDLRDAAAPWAPPTAAQIGIISAYWCKGWIIESNHICYSPCCGVALGKYGDEWDNRAESAEGYVGTIDRALTNGWNAATIGGHIVRNNNISHCEQTGIVGSLGCAFSTVTGNEIHDIHIRNLYDGAEMAGIKFHGAVDVEISHNHIYHTGCQGIWLDWMAQGTRVTRNLLNDNLSDDLLLEVDHGPVLVDNNILLSPVSVISRSQGIAYVHNLIAGAVIPNHYDDRQTPFLKPHSTTIAGLHDNPCGDDRYYNNLFVRRTDLSQYDDAQLPVWMDGNVFLDGAKPTKVEKNPLVAPEFDPALKLTGTADGWRLEMKYDPAWNTARRRQLVTTTRLGRAVIPDAAYEQPDGTPVRINTDYFGQPRNETNPAPGPFAHPDASSFPLDVW